MIEVDGLSKSFGSVHALRNVSFTVEEGEILGFLGPNGAGKSTTMRILTGFLPGDQGLVRVAGHEVSREPLAVRASLGYLPEGVPLYPEMRVREYLRFRGKLKGIPRRRRSALVDQALEHTAIKDVGARIIGTLSRGYRQRVGLADALLAEPRVLILDEPTVGLDPEQVRQFRQLLRDVGRDRTVILSTHILSEVELVCSSVVIIQNGQVVARDNSENLRRRFGGGSRVIAEIAGPIGAVRKTLGKLPSVLRTRVESPDPEAQHDHRQATDCSASAYQRYVLETEGDEDLRPLVFKAVREKDWQLRELKREEVSLEDAFVGIVGDSST